MIIEKARKFQKNIYFCFVHYAKAFDCVDHNKLWKILKEMGIPDHLTCFLKNLYAGQDTTVRHGQQTRSKLGKPSSGHRTGKSQLSLQSQRKAMPKNVQTNAQLHSSHMLAKQCSKFSKLGFNSTWTINFQMLKLYLQKAEEPEIKLPTSVGSSKKQESSRKTSISALLTMLKYLTVWLTTNCGKF